MDAIHSAAGTARRRVEHPVTAANPKTCHDSPTPGPPFAPFGNLARRVHARLHALRPGVADWVAATGLWGLIGSIVLAPTAHGTGVGPMCAHMFAAASTSRR
jgi:hypothetical protein